MKKTLLLAVCTLVSIPGPVAIGRGGTCPCGSIIRYSTTNSISASGSVSFGCGFCIGCDLAVCASSGDGESDSDSNLLGTCGGFAQALIQTQQIECEDDFRDLDLKSSSGPQANYQVQATSSSITTSLTAQASLTASASGGECPPCGTASSSAEGSGSVSVPFTVLTRGRVLINDTLTVLTGAATGSAAGSWQIISAFSGGQVLSGTGIESDNVQYTICPGNYVFTASLGHDASASASTGCVNTGPIMTAAQFTYTVNVGFQSFCAECEECVGDTNCDGQVNVDDLLAVIGAYGPNPGHAADFNCDQVINNDDLLTVIAAWGPCPK